VADREFYSFVLENVGEDLDGLLFLGSPSYVDEINAGIPAECLENCNPATSAKVTDGGLPIRNRIIEEQEQEQEQEHRAFQEPPWKRTLCHNRRQGHITKLLRIVLIPHNPYLRALNAKIPFLHLVYIRDTSTEGE
jgi:hypothetical protein